MKKYNNVLGLTVREMRSSFCNYQGIVFDTNIDIWFLTDEEKDRLLSILNSKNIS